MIAAITLLPTTPAAAAPSPARPVAAALRDEAEVVYFIKRGDTLFNLGRAYFTGDAALTRVQRLNRIGNPNLILTSRTLRVPRGALRDEHSSARIESFSGEVVLRYVGGTSAPAKAGATLGEGAIIETGRRGFVSLRLADDSTITIPSQTSLRIARLRRVLINNAVEREFATTGGRLRAKVTPMTEPSSTFRVSTPITVSAVRGTEFRVAYDATDQRALTQVEDGKVAFGAPPAKTAAPEPASDLILPGFGAVARPSGIRAPTALLPAPRLIDPDRAQTDPQLAFAITPDTQAAGYRIQIGRDAGLLDLVDEASASSPAFTLGTLPTGTYFVRVAALDGDGAEGLGRTYAFDRVLNAVAGSMAAEGRRYRFKWSSVADATPQFRFQLGFKGQLDNPLVDEAMGTATELSVTDLRPGEYAWRVLSIVPFGAKIIRAWSAEQGFEVTARR